ncbi:MAG: septum formation initiator family protein [Bacteroides sp.]|jgi:cell division protein FtsB|nr:septum formation initiator family protein [Bacteroides sp.]MBQ5818457.1 septum formation initiator family protein [Bacteroides sp.]MBR0042341.1 septum formation initiator family protein [Bacteroides sp.]
MKKYLNKYIITLGIFALIVLFLDENSMLKRMQMNQEERELREEIEKYRDDFNESTRLLGEITADSVAIEQIARERYMMKLPEEDIYVFEEDLEK